MQERIAELRNARYLAVTKEALRAIHEGDILASAEVWAARSQPRAEGNVAVIPVMGMITQRSPWWGTSVEQLRANLREAVAGSSRAIVLDVDSPGGVVSGVEEIGAEIRQARRHKPIVAVSNSLAASAAYWIASQATEVMVTPSGEIGSIGVYAMHTDVSAALDQMGVVVTFVSAGEGKVEGNPFEPLSEAAKADMETDVQRYYGMFTSAVAKGRDVSVSTIRDDWGAWVYGAKEAVEIGMADGVGTLEDAVRRAAQLAREGGGRAAALAIEVERRKRARLRGTLTT